MKDEPEKICRQLSNVEQHNIECWSDESFVFPMASVITWEVAKVCMS